MCNSQTAVNSEPIPKEETASGDLAQPCWLVANCDSITAAVLVACADTRTQAA